MRRDRAGARDGTNLTYNVSSDHVGRPSIQIYAIQIYEIIGKWQQIGNGMTGYDEYVDRGYATFGKWLLYASVAFAGAQILLEIID